MADGLDALGAAGQTAEAPENRLALLARHPRAAHGALFRHLEFRHRAAFSADHARHLGYHIAGPADDDPVAYLDILTPDLVQIVQGGIGDPGPGHGHGREPRDRGQGAGAPHLRFDGQHLRHLFRGRKLPGHGPARRARNITQRPLLVYIVDLKHHAVYVIRQRRAALANLRIVLQALLNAFCLTGLADRGQTPLAQQGQRPGMRSQHGLAPVFAYAIGEKRERPPGRDAGVQLPQAPGRRVSGVGKRFFALFALFIV